MCVCILYFSFANCNVTRQQYFSLLLCFMVLYSCSVEIKFVGLGNNVKLAFTPVCDCDCEKQRVRVDDYLCQTVFSSLNCL